MKTEHKVKIGDAREVDINRDIDLVVTSPPYPMIEMWDEIFSKMNPDIKKCLDNGEGEKAFDLMHDELNKVWDMIEDNTEEGAMVCINIGDATRKIGGSFSRYTNGCRITEEFISRGFEPLPKINWRKPTNSPTKFMGSGMLPPSAYVTLEHEHILIFRKKGGRRQPESDKRSKSAYFWEERNNWFCDLWEDVRGIGQNLSNNKLRDRSAAYPVEIPHRLISMFSVKGDTVLDPFWGTGTTSIAAMANARNSIGVEIEESFTEYFDERVQEIKALSKKINLERLKRHEEFCNKRLEEGKDFKYEMNNYNLPATTKQEKNILLHHITRLEKNGNNYISHHQPIGDFKTEINSEEKGQSKLDSSF